MAKLLTGSVCLTDLIAKAKEQHSSFVKADNGKIYCNIKVWENDQPDKFGNTSSIQLNQKKDHEAENVYIGNLKPVERKEPEAVTENDTQGIGDGLEDLQF